MNRHHTQQPRSTERISINEEEGRALLISSDFCDKISLDLGNYIPLKTEFK